MKISGDVPIATVAVEVAGATAIFESLGIDYACAGDRSLDDAAHSEGVDPAVLIAALRHLKEEPPPERWSQKSIGELVKYLKSEHQRFMSQEFKRVALHLAEICTSPTGAAADMLSLRASFARLSEVVLHHFGREEHEVFLTIEASENAWLSAQSSAPPARDLSHDLSELAIEHGTMSALLRTIRTLRLRLLESNDLPPACRSTLDDVAKIESQLHHYMFLENCILFPRVVALSGGRESAVKGVRSNGLTV